MDARSAEQKRAKFAYKKVSDVKKESKKTQGRYSSYVKSAPVMILTNGLGQTLAFYLSKIGESTDANYKNITPPNLDDGDKKAYAYLYLHISKWLAAEITEGEDPLHYYMEKDGMTAIRMTDETIALLNWMKRLASAMLADDNNEKSESGS